MTELDAAIAYLRDAGSAPTLTEAADGNEIWRRIGVDGTPERRDLVADAAAVFAWYLGSGENGPSRPGETPEEASRRVLASGLEAIGWSREFLERNSGAACGFGPPDRRPR